MYIEQTVPRWYTLSRSSNSIRDEYDVTRAKEMKIYPSPLPALDSAINKMNSTRTWGSEETEWRDNSCILIEIQFKSRSQMYIRE